MRRFVFILAASLIAVLGTACGGQSSDEPANADTPGTTQAAEETAAPAPTTTEAPADDCMSPDDVSDEVWNGQLTDGVQQPNPEAEALADNATRYNATDVFQCVYQFKFDEEFISSASGTNVQNTVVVDIVYGGATFAAARENMTEEYEQFSSDTDEPAQLLHYQDTPSYYQIVDDTFTWKYLDGDSICFGEATATFESQSAREWLAVAADQLAAEVACDLDIDVPQTPGELWD